MGFTYLDYAATTPLSEAVKNTLIESINNSDDFFNSGSSNYEQGEIISQKIELARETIAATIRVLPREIVFTSGATESNNLAIKGVAFAHKHKGNHIITSKAEHKAVLDVCKYLEIQGFEVSYLDVDSTGEIDTKELERAITNKTILISLMAVNNELGSINSLHEIGRIAKNNKIIFHVDAAQAYGKIDLSIKDMGIDLLSMSGHKIYAPKGVGFLYVRSKAPKVKLDKQIHGGTQEFDLRAGTLANHQIFALAAACQEMFKQKEKNYLYVLELRNLFLNELYEEQCGIRINTDLDNSYPGILSISFKGIKAESLLAMLDGICLSMGSACNSQAVEPSHVLSAIGLSAKEADSTIRVSFGIITTKQEVLTTVKLMKERVELLRTISPGKESVYV